jgi:hypothetical protein
VEKLTTTIKRRWLQEIVAGTKRIEYREIKPYWTERLGNVSVPFRLRLINGMSLTAPEVEVVVRRVRKNSRNRQYELHLGKILRVRHWNRRTQQPS